MRDHPATRLQERAPQLDPEILNRLRARLAELYGVNLPTKPSHVALRDPAGVLRGYAVIKRVGRGMKPVVATILGPEMKPPGERILMDKAAASPGPLDYLDVGARTVGGGLLGSLGAGALGGGAGALVSLLSRGRAPLNWASNYGAGLGGLLGLGYGGGKGYRSGRQSVARRHHPILYPFIEKFV